MFKKRKIHKNKKVIVDNIKVQIQQKQEKNNFVKTSELEVKIMTDFFGPEKNKKMEAPGIIDYNPSLCKDYNENGYCSWGSTCIYAHDRSNYKRGWELDKQWDDQQKQKKEQILKEQISKFQKEQKYIQKCSCCDQDIQQSVKASCGDIYDKKCLINILKNENLKCKKCKQKISKIFSINQFQIIFKMFKESQSIKIILQISDHIEEHLYIEDEYDFFQKIQHLQKVYNLQGFPLTRIIKQKIFSVQKDDQKKEQNQKNIKKQSIKNHIRKQSLQIETLKPISSKNKNIQELTFSNLNNSLTSNHKKVNSTFQINLYQNSNKNSEISQQKIQKKQFFKRPKIQSALQSSIYSCIKQRKKLNQTNKENTKEQNKIKNIKKNQNTIPNKELHRIYNILDQQKLGLISFKKLDLNDLSSEQLNLAQNHLLKMSYNSQKNFSLNDFLQLSQCN